MSLPKIAIVVCLTVALAAAVVSNLDRSRYEPTAPYKDKLIHWKTRIHAVGAARAHEEIATSVKGFIYGTQHMEMHIFASALYSEKGLSGVSVCDARFEYACFHQLIAEALAERGVGSLNDIIEACKGGPGCRHSIGHGVLGLAGYTFPDLERAISICETLPSAVYMKGCFGGAIMEYNMRTLLGEARVVRPIREDWLEPCDQLPGSSKRVCYFWQPTWWRSELQSADNSLSPSALERMGELCRTITEKEFRDACFEGVGVSALNAGHSTRDGVSACAYAATDAHHRALCRTSVARFVALLHGTDQGRSVCLGLESAYRAACLRTVMSADPHESSLGEILPFDK